MKPQLALGLICSSATWRVSRLGPFPPARDVSTGDGQKPWHERVSPNASLHTQRVWLVAFFPWTCQTGARGCSEGGCWVPGREQLRKGRSQGEAGQAQPVLPSAAACTFGLPGEAPCEALGVTACSAQGPAGVPPTPRSAPRYQKEGAARGRHSP